MQGILRGFLLRFAATICAAYLSTASHARATDFVVRKVTDFESQAFVVPLGVVDDQLIFITPKNNDATSLYRTDGVNVELIDDTLEIFPRTITGITFAQTDTDIFFRGDGPNGSELYATDGHTLRQVADINPGAAGSSPNNFLAHNGKVLFDATAPHPTRPGATARALFHTDGSGALPFPVNAALDFPSLDPPNRAELDNRLVFRGSPVGGGTATPYSTDGTNLTSITAIGGQLLSSPQHITRAGNQAWFDAGGLADPGIYRSDGFTAELVAKLNQFTFTNTVSHMFELNSSLFIMVDDTFNDTQHIYRTTGGVPTEVVTIPYDDEGPAFIHSDGVRALFVNRNGNGAELREFDGNSLTFLTDVPTISIVDAREIDGRLFIGNVYGSLFGASTGNELFELVGDEVVPLGPGMTQLTTFRGEVIAVDGEENIFRPHELWRTVDGQLTPFDDVVAVRYPGFQTAFGGDEIRFVEFGGQLYFGGAQVEVVNGIPRYRTQLLALVPVPEPATSALMIACVALGAYCTRRR